MGDEQWAEVVEVGNGWTWACKTCDVDAGGMTRHEEFAVEAAQDHDMEFHAE